MGYNKTSSSIPKSVAAIALDAADLTARLGIDALSGLMFTDSALINLNLLCHQLADHPRVTFIPTPGTRSSQCHRLRQRQPRGW